MLVATARNRTGYALVAAALGSVQVGEVGEAPEGVVRVVAEDEVELCPRCRADRPLRKIWNEEAKGARIAKM